MRSAMDELLAELKTSHELGKTYLADSLTASDAKPVALHVTTSLAAGGDYGRGKHGWAVRGGVANSYTYAVLADAVVLGNRSLLARFSFRSTLTGVAPGQHGMVEMRLSKGTNESNIPLRIRVDNGKVYVLELNSDEYVIAGSRTEPIFEQWSETTYSLTVVLFRKGIFIRLSGDGIPSGSLVLSCPDRRRYIPGLPGFGIHPNEQAAGGEITVFDWSVEPLGPYRCKLAVIGDSITAGPDREPEAESYVHEVTQRLGQKHVLNVGSGGSTTTIDAARFAYEIAPFEPEVVWIEGGTNDIGTGGDAATAYANLMKQVEAVTWGGQAVLSTVPPRVLADPAQYEQLFLLNDRIRNSGLPVVDRYRIVVDPQDRRYIDPLWSHDDGIHIKYSGNSRIALAAAETIGKLLQSS